MAAKWELFGTTTFIPGFFVSEDFNDTVDALIAVVNNGY